MSDASEESDRVCVCVRWTRPLQCTTAHVVFGFDILSGHHGWKQTTLAAAAAWTALSSLPYHSISSISKSHVPGHGAHLASHGPQPAAVCPLKQRGFAETRCRNERRCTMSRVVTVKPSRVAAAAACTFVSLLRHPCACSHPCEPLLVALGK